MVELLLFMIRSHHAHGTQRCVAEQSYSTSTALTPTGCEANAASKDRVQLVGFLLKEWRAHRRNVHIRSFG